MTSKSFGSLREKIPADGTDPMRVVNGSLSLHLVSGEYILFYLPSNALINDLQVFKFTVFENGKNQFSFTVD